MRYLCILLSVFCVLQFSSSFAQQNGIKIKIRDDQNLNMPGASISLSSLGMNGVSNNAGEWISTGLKPGEYTLTISYIGYKSIEIPVSVDNGVIKEYTVKLQTGSDTQQEVLVMGDRLKGQSKALNQQKNSDHITNIISADQIGRFPDANVGDAIKRIPGITMQNDQGEARNIIIRGMGPEFNSVMLNGERIPSAEGDNRRIQMDLIPSDMVQTVEVNKTLTADMDADAIGGSVNLITRSAPDALRLSATVSGGYQPIREGFMGTAAIIAGTRFAKQKIGFIVNGSINTNDYGSDNIESVWMKDENGKTFIGDHDIRVYNIKRIRRSLSGTIDFRLHPLHTIYLTGNYNWRDDKENRFRLRHRYRGDEEDYVDDLVYSNAGEITGYDNGEVLRQTKGGLSSGRNEGRRLEDQRVRMASVRGEHIFGKLITNWSFQYSLASEKRPNERYIAMGARGINISQDISDPERPLLLDQTVLSDYTRLDELTEQFQDQHERDLNGKLDFELPVNLIAEKKGSVIFGGRIRSKLKERENTFYSYEPTEDEEGNYENISLLPLSNKTPSNFYPGKKFVAGQFIDPSFLGNVDLLNSALFDQTDEPSEYLAGNFKARETISAAYLAWKQELTKKFSMNIGVRIEHTNINYTGNVVEEEEVLKSVNSLKNNYTDILPSVNLIYRFNKSLVLKGAYTNSLARPRYYDLVPYFNVNPNDLELSAGNPSLDAVRSSNIDLMVEKYFASVGILSGGVFYKKINQFFYTYIDNNYTADKFDKDFPGIANPIDADDNWDFSQRRNGDGATLAGFEVALQRQLSFLPGVWKGLGVFVNYTYTHSNADGIYDADGNLVRNDVKLPGAAPHIFNASLSFENKKTVIRLSGNFTSSYVDDSDDAGYNEDSFFDRYYDKQFFLDANASYAILPKLRIFAEANNLTNQPLRYFQGIKERTAQLEYYGPRFNMGLKFDLNK